MEKIHQILKELSLHNILTFAGELLAACTDMVESQWYKSYIFMPLEYFCVSFSGISLLPDSPLLLHTQTHIKPMENGNKKRELLWCVAICYVLSKGGWIKKIILHLYVKPNFQQHPNTFLDPDSTSKEQMILGRQLDLPETFTAWHELVNLSDERDIFSWNLTKDGVFFWGTFQSQIDMEIESTIENKNISLITYYENDILLILLLLYFMGIGYILFLTGLPHYHLLSTKCETSWHLPLHTQTPGLNLDQMELRKQMEFQTQHMAFKVLGVTTTFEVAHQNDQMEVELQELMETIIEDLHTIG
ncbi:hypothetical protein ACJX0J_039866 [Zea mays]